MSDHDPLASADPALPQPPPPEAFVSRHQRPAPPPSGAPTVGYPVRPATTDAPPPAAGVLRPSMSRGILSGLLAAFLGGALWYAVVVVIDRQYFLLAILLGMAIGYAVSWGAGTGGVATAAASAGIGVVAAIGSYYYIDRHLISEAAKTLGGSLDYPVIPGLDDLREVLRIGFEADGGQYLFCFLCVAAAGFFGYKGIQQSRRFGP